MADPKSIDQRSLEDIRAGQLRRGEINQSSEGVDKGLLALVANLASGMMSNPHSYESRDWEDTVVKQSVRMANKILLELKRTS